MFVVILNDTALLLLSSDKASPSEIVKKSTVTILM